MTFLSIGLVAISHVVSFLVFSTCIFIAWNYVLADLHEGITTINWLQACMLKLGLIGIKHSTLISLSFTTR
jgi:hypothetical protein